jgi:hypothetical protein
LFKEIVDHQKDSNKAVEKANQLCHQNGKSFKKKMTAGWQLEVEWRDGTTSWLPLKTLKIQIQSKLLSMHVLEIKLILSPLLIGGYPAQCSIIAIVSSRVCKVATNAQISSLSYAYLLVLTTQRKLTTKMGTPYGWTPYRRRCLQLWLLLRCNWRKSSLSQGTKSTYPWSHCMGC